MFTNLSFDELNALVKNERSMSFKKYFGEMNLPEEEKSKRIQMAEELEENFIVTMTLLFTMAQANKINYELIRKQIEDSYLETLRKYTSVDKYLETYVKSFTYDVIDSTKTHKNEPYYYSLDRARRDGDWWETTVPKTLNGVYVVELTATDEAGNIAYTAKYILTIDITALRVKLQRYPYSAKVRVGRYFARLK